MSAPVITTSVLAGPLTRTPHPPTPMGKHMFIMGHNFTLHIDAPTARQWIQALSEITESEQ